jgi:hypothetical protein
MTTITLTSAQLLKAINLGYYDIIEHISVFKKVVKHYKVCGRTEELTIEIKNN